MFSLFPSLNICFCKTTINKGEWLVLYYREASCRDKRYRKSMRLPFAYFSNLDLVGTGNLAEPLGQYIEEGHYLAEDNLLLTRKFFSLIKEFIVKGLLILDINLAEAINNGAIDFTSNYNIDFYLDDRFTLINPLYVHRLLKSTLLGERRFPFGSWGSTDSFCLNYPRINDYIDDLTANIRQFSGGLFFENEIENWLLTDKESYQ